jgi:group I intron endonuclease
MSGTLTATQDITIVAGMTDKPKGRWATHNPNITVIKQDTGEEVVINISVKKWCKNNLISYKSFNQMLKGRSKTSSGYYLKGTDPTHESRKGVKRKPHSEEWKENRSKQMIKGKYKDLYIVDISTGVEYCVGEIPYVKKFAEEHGVKYSSFSHFIHGSSKSCGNKFVTKQRWDELQEQKKVAEFSCEKVSFFNKEYVVADWIEKDKLKVLLDPMRIAKGIYAIVNIKNGKFYIGSSVHIRSRWSTHKKELTGKKHHCKHLQNAWNKYGADSFAFIILEQFEDTATVQDLETTEKKYLDKYFDGGAICYNASRETDRVDVTDFKIRVRQIDMATKQVIKVHESLSDAAKELNLTTHDGVLAIGRITKVCKKLSEHCAGFLWEYDDDEERKKYENKVFEKWDRGKRRVVKVYEDGRIDAIYDSLVDAAKMNGLKSYTSVLNACAGVRKSAGGFVFKYYGDMISDKLDFNVVPINEEVNCRKEYYDVKDPNKKFLLVFEDELKDKKDLVNSMVNARLGMSKNVYNGRELSVVELDTKEERLFFNENHISGHTSSNMCFGLKTKDNVLVAAISFRIPRNSLHVSSIEVARYAVLLDSNVRGGFSKLLKHGEKYYANKDYTSVISYCDLRYGDGNVYEQNGFKLVSEIKDNYWYSDGIKRVFRFQVRAENGKSEKEVAKEKGVWRIYGCGNKLFKKEITVSGN